MIMQPGGMQSLMEPKGWRDEAHRKVWKSIV